MSKVYIITSSTCNSFKDRSVHRMVLTFIQTALHKTSADRGYVTPLQNISCKIRH